MPQPSAPANAPPAAKTEDYLALLTVEFARSLIGEKRYVTVLLELRARNVPDEDTYWKTVADLRAAGALGGDAYGQLLDRLYARKLVDDIGYRCRCGRTPPALDDKPLLRVAEPRAGYDAKRPPKGRQTDLFE